MIKRDVIGKSALALAIAAASIVAACGGGQGARPPTTAQQQGGAATPSVGARSVEASALAPGNVEVLLCDGKTKISVASGTPGTAIAGQLMAEWMRKNPSSNWEAEERERHTLQPAADNSGLIGLIDGHTYGKITAQDVASWKTET